MSSIPFGGYLVPHSEVMLMKSVAEQLRSDLEACGEYVVRANADNGWFAVFPKTLRDRIKRTNEDGRSGPNLVVYRTKSHLTHDHYVIPYSVASKMLIKNALTKSKVNGVERWNLTLKEGHLRVSHQSGAVDVSEYYGLPLFLEDHYLPGLALEPETTPLPHGVREGRLRLRNHLRRERDPRIVRVKKRTASSLSCEICGFSFGKRYGDIAAGFCEAHHLLPLSEVDETTITHLDDLAIVCANCHRVIHLRNPPYSLDEVRGLLNAC